MEYKIEYKIEYNDNKTNSECLKFNEKLNGKYKNQYYIISDDLIVHNEHKFILSIYNVNDLIFKIEYVWLGSYSKKKNFWIWSDKSLVGNKIMINMVHNIRNTTPNEELKQFIENDYSILPTQKFHDYLCLLERHLRMDIITCPDSNNRDIIIVFGIKKILFDGLSNE
jgi:hypothetical protein